jgi:hypothetical protein
MPTLSGNSLTNTGADCTASMRRLRSALAELGEADDPDHVMVPPALERVFTEVRPALLDRRAA